MKPKVDWLGLAIRAMAYAPNKDWQGHDPKGMTISKATQHTCNAGTLQVVLIQWNDVTPDKYTGYTFKGFTLGVLNEDTRLNDVAPFILYPSDGNLHGDSLADSVLHLIKNFNYDTCPKCKAYYPLHYPKHLRRCQQCNTRLNW